LGAGGDIFVMAGASLAIIGGSLFGGAVIGGRGGQFTSIQPAGGNGQAFGGGLFLQGNETVTLAPPAATGEVISGVIGDQTGSGGTGVNAGAGNLVLNGLGTLDLAAANTFTGGVKIDEGTLELSNSAAAGSGTITFAPGANATIELDSGAFAPNPIAGFATGDALRFIGAGSATLAGPASGGEIDFFANAVDYVRLKTGSKLGATISGFATGDAVDFENVLYASTDKPVYATGAVSIENSARHTVASFHVSGTHTSANFKLNNDGSGHILVSYAATPASAAAGEVGGGRSADLLGRYGSAFAEAPSTPTSEALAFDAWTALGSSAGTYSGGFGFHYENDGNVGGGRDALGVSFGWNGPIGHGPGPGST
jgi:autotransporter-associated beta strand protein